MAASQKIFNGIDTIILRVSDLRASKQWYEEKLGLTTLYADVDSGLVVLDTGGATSLTLYQTSEPIANNAETASFPIFSTADAALTRHQLQQRGVETSELTVDKTVSFFMFYDPDGNLLEACQVHAG